MGTSPGTVAETATTRDSPSLCPGMRGTVKPLPGLQILIASWGFRSLVWFFELTNCSFRRSSPGALSASPVSCRHSSNPTHCCRYFYARGLECRAPHSGAATRHEGSTPKISRRLLNPVLCQTISVHRCRILLNWTRLPASAPALHAQRSEATHGSKLCSLHRTAPVLSLAYLLFKRFALV